MRNNVTADNETLLGPDAGPHGQLHLGQLEPPRSGQCAAMKTMTHMARRQTMPTYTVPVKSGRVANLTLIPDEEFAFIVDFCGATNATQVHGVIAALGVWRATRRAR